MGNAWTRWSRTGHGATLHSRHGPKLLRASSAHFPDYQKLLGIPAEEHRLPDRLESLGAEFAGRCSTVQGLERTHRVLQAPHAPQVVALGMHPEGRDQFGDFSARKKITEEDAGPFSAGVPGQLVCRSGYVPGASRSFGLPGSSNVSNAGRCGDE